MDSYATLWHRYGSTSFPVRDLPSVLGGTPTLRAMTMGRLVRRGSAVRLSRGRYALLRPLSRLSESATRWPARVPSPSVRTILRLSLSALDGALGDRLVSVALYGSYARGTERPNSDVDLLVVMEGPLRPKEETELAMRVRAVCTEALVQEWRTTRTHPVPQPVFLTTHGLARGSTFLLDLTREAILLYDRARFLELKLDQLARRAASLGIQRRSLPHDRWYWAMPPSTPLSALNQET